MQLFAGLSKDVIEKVLAGSSEHERLAASEGDLMKTVEELGRLH